jgi:hypothetical protein
MKLQGSEVQDHETLQSQIGKIAENRLPLSGLEIFHGRLPRTQAVRAARRAALWGLGGPPFCKPFGKCFVSGYRTLEARLLVSFEASTAAPQQPLPTMRTKFHDRFC